MHAIDCLSITQLSLLQVQGKVYMAQEEKSKWLQELGEERANWLAQLPFSLSVPSLNLLVVHAGLIPGIPLKEQSLKTLTEVCRAVLIMALAEHRMQLLTACSALLEAIMQSHIVTFCA